MRIFLNYISWPLFARRRLSKLNGEYDLVFCYNTSPVLMAYPAIVAARKYNVPLCLYVLDIWPENLYSVLGIKSKLLRRWVESLSNTIYSHADSLIVLSESMRARILSRINVPEESLSVIPQHAEDFYSIPICDEDLHSRFKGKQVFVFAGNLSPAQGLDEVIESFVEAYNSNKDIVFLVVGDGMSEAHLKLKVKALNAEGYIIFEGRKSADSIPRYSELATAMVASFSTDPALELTIPAKILPIWLLASLFLPAWREKVRMWFRDSTVG